MHYLKKVPAGIRQMGNHTTVSTFLLWGFSCFSELQSPFCKVTMPIANMSVMIGNELNHNLYTLCTFSSLACPFQKLVPLNVSRLAIRQQDHFSSWVSHTDVFLLWLSR